MYQIRHAILEDCPGIAKTQVDSYRTAYAGLFPTPYLEHFTYAEEEQDWIRMLTSSTDDILLVATSQEKQIVGYVLARAKPDIFPGYDSEIVALHVRQSFQGKGIGRALLSQAIKDLMSRDCRSVMLWTLKNNKARQWYEKLNGKLLGEKDYEVDDWVIREVAYGWEEISTLL
jgi:ribosomal protein S18 acetylase RimI-like enzyme